MRVGGVTRVGRLVRVRFGLVLVFLVLRVRVVVTRGSLVAFVRVVRTGVVDGWIVREGSVPVVRGPRVVVRDVRTGFAVVVVVVGRRVGAETRVGRLVRVRFIFVDVFHVVLVRVVDTIGFRVGFVRAVRTGAVSDLVVRGG